MSSDTLEMLDCTRELRWLKEHRHEYTGQWVALDGDRLVAHGISAQEVRDAAHRNGVELPLMVHIESVDELPFGGW